jgi:riboflavin kinase/FMN adenylyltransferase
MVTKGKVADAAILLGRPYRLIGNIMPGRGKGKQLGFPTLNLKKPQQIIPAEGVYAGTVEVAESIEKVCVAKEIIPAAFSIGRAETFGNDSPVAIEAHLLTENIALVSDKWLAMDFIERIRNQRKFNTSQELAEQIDRDCRKAQQILRNVVA